MNTNRLKITRILSNIFPQLTLILLLTTCVTGVLAGCGNNPLQNQQESEGNSLPRNSGDREQRNHDSDDNDNQENSQDKDDEDDDREDSKRRGSDND